MATSRQRTNRATLVGTFGDAVVGQRRLDIERANALSEAGLARPVQPDGDRDAGRQSGRAPSTPKPADGRSDSRESSELTDANRGMLRRQQEFLLAAEFVSRAFGAVPSVERVTLFGSVAAPLQRGDSRHASLRRYRGRVLHECKDVDLAVHLLDLGSLRALQRARSRALNRLFDEKGIGVAHHQVDTFILEPGTDRYLGRLCHFSRCPASKPECRVPGCGESLLLRQHEGFVLDAGALAPGQCRILFDARCP